MDTEFDKKFLTMMMDAPANFFIDLKKELENNRQDGCLTAAPDMDGSMARSKPTESSSIRSNTV